MSSIQRPLSGDVLPLDLNQELDRTTSHPALADHGRVARTLAKDGALRVILVALAPGGGLQEHRAVGPVTLQSLRGEIRVTTGEGEETLTPGHLLVLGAGVEHGVTSAGGGAFLLTVTHPPAAVEEEG